MSLAVGTVAQTVAADSIIAIGVTSFMEVAFPQLDKSKPVYMTALEAAGQAFFSTLLTLEIRSNLTGVYQNDPTGGFVAVPLTLALQPKMLSKFLYLQQNIVEMTTSFYSEQ